MEQRERQNDRWITRDFPQMQYPSKKKIHKFNKIEIVALINEEPFNA